MDLKSLYRDVIIDHNRSPRNFRRIERPRQDAEGHNPLCGDKLHVYLKLKDDHISDISFEGSGCAISVASASMMTEALMGKTVADATDTFKQMQSLLVGNGIEPTELSSLGKLAALTGVREFPMRVKCATLCWHTMKQALADTEETTTTE